MRASKLEIRNAEAGNKMNIMNDVFETNVPSPTGNIKKTHIIKKLDELNYPVKDISLGKFDYIGEFTAKKQRSSDSELFSKAGAFYRPNYERGMLIYALIKKYNIKSYLEIGYGRGYSCFCAALAMSECGNDGKVFTVDPALSQEQVQGLTQVFPADWFQRINFFKSTSDEFFQNKGLKETFDMIYIDGDHRYEAVKNDWINSRTRFNKIALFDDYHLPDKSQKDIEVASVVDAIYDHEKELIITDRRIFHDDRGYTDDQINYGQVLIVK